MEIEKVLTEVELQEAIESVKKAIKKKGSAIKFDVVGERNIMQPESNNILVRGSFVNRKGEELAAITMLNGGYGKELLGLLVGDLIEGYEADRKRKEE